MTRLVAIGDSLTQGFQSLAITYPNRSYPAMIAECMGIPGLQFALPDFSGKGGLPCNIEWLARKLEESYGANLNIFEWASAIFTITDLIDNVEDFWERGPGSMPTLDRLYHNLAIWGFEAGDAYNITAGMCRQAIVNNTRDDRFGIPSDARLRTAFRVLNPAQKLERDPDTQIAVAKRIQAVSPIDNLIVFLGANNCLGTVVELDVRKTGDEPPGPNSGCTLWTPAAFKKEYERLANEIVTIGATHVYVATVPHVTIPPVTRGIMKNRGKLPESRTHFDYYTRFFIQDKEFDPDRDPFLTREEAEEIDEHIDVYNEVIRACAKANGWIVVDLCDILGRLAIRRNHGKPKMELPPPIAELNTRFFEIFSNGKIKSGGLFSLDGVHPTSCGYAVIAQAFIDAMRPFEPAIRDIDFAAVRKWDTLVTRPPLTLDDIFEMLRTLEKYFHLSGWMRAS